MTSALITSPAHTTRRRPRVATFAPRTAAPTSTAGVRLSGGDVVAGWHDHCEHCHTADNHGHRWCGDCDWDR